MTRKDFNLIAAAINEARLKIENTPATKSVDVVGKIEMLRGVEQTARQLAIELIKTNPRFAYDRFITACGF